MNPEFVFEHRPICRTKGGCHRFIFLWKTDSYDMQYYVWLDAATHHFTIYGRFGNYGNYIN